MMPRPPILPAIDWKTVFQEAMTYDDWLKTAENPENAEKIQTNRKDLQLQGDARKTVEQLSRPVHVIAIAEAWCGDVVRHVPMLEKLREAGPNLKVRYISREQRPDVFVRFLTNGGEAIPKFVFLSEDFVECGNWGPMPEACREWIARGKACNNISAAREKVSELYNADPELCVVASELAQLADIASSTLG